MGCSAGAEGRIAGSFSFLIKRSLNCSIPSSYGLSKTSTDTFVPSDSDMTIPTLPEDVLEIIFDFVHDKSAAPTGTGPQSLA